MKSTNWLIKNDPLYKYTYDIWYIVRKYNKTNYIMFGTKTKITMDLEARGHTSYYSWD